VDAEDPPDWIVGTTLPHSSFGDPDCCGCLNGLVRGDQADIICNECESVVRTVPASSLEQTLTEMELTLDVADAMCPALRNRKPVFGIYNDDGIHLPELRSSCEAVGRPPRPSASSDNHTENSSPKHIIARAVESYSGPY
jgi:hypothetical protein